MKTLELVFMGSPDFALPTLRALETAGHRIRLVITQPDKRAGRGRKPRPCAVAAAARETGLAVSQPAKVGEIAEELESTGAQVAVVVAYGQLLPPRVLKAFPLGCVNLHASLLPRLRGAAPINWAIINGHESSGASTMLMDRGLDTGDIILQAETPIGPQETAGSLSERLAVMGGGLMLETLEALARGGAPRTPQDNDHASYAPLLRKSDGLLDFSRPAEELERRVRGLDPWPGAYTLMQGQPFKLFGPVATGPRPDGAAPGQVLPAPADAGDLLWIACGQGALGLGQVQAPGKKRLSAADFLRGSRLEPGRMLSD